MEWNSALYLPFGWPICGIKFIVLNFLISYLVEMYLKLHNILENCSTM